MKLIHHKKEEEPLGETFAERMAQIRARGGWLKTFREDMAALAAEKWEGECPACGDETFFRPGAMNPHQYQSRSPLEDIPNIGPDIASIFWECKKAAFITCETCEEVLVICPYCDDAIKIPPGWTTPHAVKKTCRACKKEYQIG